MAKYQKRPVEVEAVRWDGSDEALDAIYAMAGDARRAVVVRKHASGGAQRVLSIVTLEGEMVANEGDYVIRGVQGELYPCKPGIFEATYERSGEAVST